MLENPANNYDFDLSEEFLLAVLKQVDELCENINNGDPNWERTLEVNQKINNSVNCYKEKLLEISESKSDLNLNFDSINVEDFEYEIKPKQKKEIDSEWSPPKDTNEYKPIKTSSKKSRKNSLRRKGLKQEI